MERGLNFIFRNINMVIIVFGIILLIWIIYNYYQLGKQKGKIDVITNEKTRRNYVDRRTGQMYEQEEEQSVTPETLREYEKQFYKTRSGYDMYVQLISLFPLLGILGTVSGLMSQVVAENMDALNASLTVALGSTVWGLIWAIGLKIIVVLFPGKIVDEIEIMLDNWFDKFNDTISQKNILDEQ